MLWLRAVADALSHDPVGGCAAVAKLPSIFSDCSRLKSAQLVVNDTPDVTAYAGSFCVTRDGHPFDVLP